MIREGCSKMRLLPQRLSSLLAVFIVLTGVLHAQLPSGWLDTDIGSSGGSATYSSGKFTVTAKGIVGGTADTMHFVYQSLSGDGSIVARVSSLQGATSPNAGVMIRESLNANSTNAFVFYLSNFTYQRTRTTTGASAGTQSISYSSPASPYWVKLVRSGSTFTGYISQNNFDWTQVATTTINMAQNVYIGLGLASGAATTLETATFDSVSVNSSAAPAPVITGFSATTGSVGGQVILTGTGFGNGEGGAVLLNGIATTINSWSDTSINVTIPTGATSGLLIVLVPPTMNGSNTIYFTVTAQPLPLGWLDTDVGTVSAVGSASYSGGTFTIAGTGSIGSTADTMHFVYQPFAGDGTITTRTVTTQGRAAVMIRETLATGSADAYIYISSNQAFLTYRATAGGSITNSSGTSVGSTIPYWLRLTRSGNSFTAYFSKNGVDWTQVGTAVTVMMATNVYIGVAEAGSGSSITSTFDSGSISSTAAPAPVISNISATTASVGNQVQLTGANFGASVNGSQVIVNATQATINSWSDSSVVFTVPTGATSGLVFVLKAPTMNASNPAYLTVTTQPLPSPWVDYDVGTPTTAGSATYSSGTFTIKGAGGIGSTADSFHYVYQSLAGDGSIVSRVSSLSGTSSAQVGVMVRETLAQGSTYALVYFRPNQAFLSYRTTTGAVNSTQTTSFSSAAAPYWVRLIRTGNSFTAYLSTNGTSWTQAGTSTTITMASSVYIGMAISGGTGALETAALDNASVTVGTTPYISSVTPLVGGVGTSVTVTGSNFGSTQGPSVLNFNGVPAASVTSWNDSQVVGTVPSNVPSGNGPVTIVVNSITSNGNVTFTAINPVLTGITPVAAAAGATVTLNGTGLTLPGQTTQVNFNGITAQILSSSGTAITIYVPGTATSGPVTVSVGSYTSNAIQFTVEGRPTISSVSPSSGVIGAWPITISGTGFGATQSNSTLVFNNSSPPQIVSWSDTAITAVVPDDAETGPLTVTVGGFTNTGGSFQVMQSAQLTDSLGNQTTYTAQIVGQSWHVSDSQGSGCSSCTQRGTIHSQYDNSGNLVSKTDELGRTTSYAYDSNNNLTSVTQYLDANTPVTTSYTYNSFGEALTMTDPLGTVTTNAYDAHGNLTSVTSPRPDSNTSPSVTGFAYDTKGELTSITDPLNNPSTLTYTTAGLIASITDAQNHTTTYQYDSRGNRTAVIDPINGAGHPTTFTYDLMSRLTGITYPDGSSVSFGYDSRGRRTSVTDQNSKVTTYTYDDADRLTVVTDPSQHSTQYNYDTENNLTNIVDANGHSTTFTYDAFGRVTQTAFPSSLAEAYAYDAVGNLTSKTDRNGNTIQYVYDALNRLASKSYPDSTSANYVYDLVGKIRQVTDPTGVYGFAYDNMGRLIGTSTQYTFVTGMLTNAYTYDAGSNRKSLTAPDGSITTYGYDTLNRLNGMANSWAGSFGFGYDALSRRTSLTRPNGVTTNYGYDSLSRLLSVLHQTGGTTLDGASYTYDPAGNRTSKINYLNGTTENYAYDTLYELTQVTQGNTTTESYNYDPVGNRLSSVGVPLYNYNSSNELTSNSLGNYTYDANGSTLSDPTGKTYTWDFENRLSSVFVPNTGTLTFRYDPFGRRIQKSGPSGTTNYLYDDANLLGEVDQSGNVLAQYAQGADIDSPLSELRSGATNYYEQDVDGSASSLSTAAANLAVTYGYDSFGQLINFTGTLTNPFRYTAREFDPETGIYEYRARYYDPSIGRFITEDPISFLGGDANLYRYVWNSPTNFNDSIGEVGAGISVSGSVEGGAISPSAGTTGAAGMGVFSGKSCCGNGSAGTFASGGAFAGGPGWGKAAPSSPSNKNWVFGGYTGGGLNFWISNAKTVCDLSGPFRTYSINAGWHVKVFSLQLSRGRNAAGELIWQLSYGGPVGPLVTGGGYGLSVSGYNTYTVTETRCCK